jgi:signal transduction histidine kinase
MKVTFKLVAAFFACFLGVAAFTTAVRVRREIDHFQEDMRRDHALLARQLGNAVEGVWAADGEHEAMRVISPRGAPDHVKVAWRWLDDPNPPLPSGVTPSYEQAVHWVGPCEPSGECLRTFLAVASPGARQGGLLLTESLDDQVRYVGKTIRTALSTVAGMALLLGLVMAILGEWLVRRPVHRLVEKARRVGQGDWRVEADPRGTDELAELMREMNRACHLLADGRRKLDAETEARLSTVEQLRHAERLGNLGKMAAGIAHELGTPLNVISLRARAIATQEVSGHTAAESAGVIHQQSQHMATTIRQLLDFSRTRHPKRSAADLVSIARNTLELVAPFARKHHVDCIREGAVQAPIVADVDQIQQVLGNLLVNAAQAMPKGGTVKLSVLESERPAPPDLPPSSNHWWVVHVDDTGHGIPHEIQKRVFEPFFTTKDVGEGTGLGLSVSYGLVHEHGGWIELWSEPGRGTRFSVYLPRGA